MRMAHIKRARECTYFTRDFLVPLLRASADGHKRIYNPLSAVAKAQFGGGATVQYLVEGLLVGTKQGRPAAQ
jgi:hypothetical protein